MSAERLQKILARGGIASRRAAEELISEGRVRVNGRVVKELGTRADPRKDRIEVDGERVVAEHPVYYALHKPRGYVTTLHDPEGRPTIRNLLRPHGVDARVFPVGRLDFNTSGLLLVTNDGEFSDGLLHPKREVPKTYVVKVSGRMEPEDVEKWRRGVMLDDGRTKPADVQLLRYEEDKTWIEITIREGRNQQIRRMGDATGFRVMRLSRLAFAGISSEGLRPGDLRPLTFDELVALKKSYGVPRNPSAAKGPPRTQPKHRARLDRPERREASSVDADAAWGRDRAGASRPQAARARHAFARPTSELPRGRQGGFRGHGPDDDDPREVPRMPTNASRSRR